MLSRIWNEVLCWRLIALGQRLREGCLIAVARVGPRPNRGEEIVLWKVLSAQKIASTIYYPLQSLSSLLLHCCVEFGGIPLLWRNLDFPCAGQVVYGVCFQLKPGWAAVLTGIVYFLTVPVDLWIVASHITSPGISHGSCECLGSCGHSLISVPSPQNNVLNEQGRL